MIYYNSETLEFMDKHDGDPKTKKYPDCMRYTLPTAESLINDWRTTEKKWIDEQIELKSDSNKNAKATTMNDLRKYRNEVRDYESGDKPVRP